MILTPHEIVIGDLARLDGQPAEKVTGICRTLTGKSWVLTLADGRVEALSAEYPVVIRRET